MIFPPPLITTCAICGEPFEARTSYGLCKFCWSRDRLREWDRVRTACTQAEKRGLPATLTLVQWLSTVSDFGGKCAYCREVFYGAIAVVTPELGVTWENTVPICRACAIHKHGSFDAARERVANYLRGERCLRTEGWLSPEPEKEAGLIEETS